ncbi:MAG TPA: thioether cross-link-forming SCIFF peptide maturase [Syntrophomonadaceae bacterium]|nr:thioether cross-link-forming SCIFF peptide maturase [Syntrophomonadaceae bacterium]
MYIWAGYDFEAHIHLYKWQELNILLDVNSGAIHVVDDLAFRFISLLMKYKGDFHQALEDCQHIYTQSEIETMFVEILTAYEKGALFTEPDDIKVDLSQMTPKALCLNVAHACNMKCKYCFASQGNFGMNPSLMPYAIGQQALDFLVKESGTIKNLEVDFFGGEPLLNFEVVKELVKYGRKIEAKTDKKFNFTLTTNGLLLNKEIMDFIIAEEISIILSLDGRPEINDQNRVLNDGSGTYELILPKIKEMVSKDPISYYIRGTFTRDNLNFSQDLVHMVELGFNSISLEPAVGPELDESIKTEDLPHVLKEYEKLTDVLLDYHKSGQQIHFFHYNLNLQRGPCLAKRHTGCSAGVEYLAVTPEGDIYPCHQLVGEDKYIMGNVSSAAVLDKDIRHIFTHNTLSEKEICQHCWARNFCGGGCHVNNLKANGDIKKPDEISCNMHKKRIEGAIFLDLMKQIEY